MKIAPREQLILVAVGLAVVILAVVFLLVWPQYQKGKQLDVQITSAEQQLASAQTLLAQRQQIKNRVAATDAKWLRLASLVPEYPDLPSLIIDLQDTAFASGVQLIGVVPAVPVLSEDKTYFRVPMQITIHGTWADTVHYLKSIAKLDRGVREVQFTSSVKNGIGNPALPSYSEESVIELEAYVIPIGTAAAPAAAPAPAAP